MNKIIIILAICIIAACVPALYQPTAETAAVSGTRLEDLQHGRQLYINHCGSCHQLYLPRQFSETRWKGILDSMKLRSKTTPGETEMIFKFLKGGL